MIKRKLKKPNLWFSYYQKQLQTNAVALLLQKAQKWLYSKTANNKALQQVFVSVVGENVFTRGLVSPRMGSKMNYVANKRKQKTLNKKTIGMPTQHQIKLIATFVVNADRERGWWDT